MRLPSPRLLLITDRGQASQSIEDVMVAAAGGGCRWVSLREKDLDDTKQARLFQRLARGLRPLGVTVTVHGPAELARLVDADGVHLPDGMSAGAARRLLGSGKLVGVSAHSVAEAAQAVRDGADYISLSPIYTSASKPGYGPCLGIEGLAEIARRVDIPILALGGIAAGNLAACVQAGAAGVAVMGEVMRAADPSACVTGLVAALND